jgi:hypothetical protein
LQAEEGVGKAVMNERRTIAFQADASWVPKEDLQGVPSAQAISHFGTP